MLGATLKVELPPEAGENAFPTGMEVVAGIRSEDVKVIPSGPEQPPHVNVFAGTLRAVFDRVSSYTLHFQAQACADRVIELEVGSRAFAKLGLAHGAEVRIAFKPSQLFLMGN